MSIFQSLLGSLRHPAFILLTATSAFLVVYHISKLVSVFTLGDELEAIIVGQSALRLMIVISLTALILGVRHAIWAMWISICALITTQYVVTFGVAPDARWDPSYLRGLMLPVLISALSWYHRQT